METKLQKEIINVLKAFPEYWHEDTLIKSKLIEDIRLYNKKVIEALISNELIKDTYSLELSSGLVFKVEDFVSMLRFKNYLDNNYTKYTNEIGLTSESKYLKYNSDVVLDFPHKDGVLEGGMTVEDTGKSEVYYHNTLAKEEIDTLLSPKIFTNSKKYNKDGENEVISIKDSDNLIIKGNNLIALHSLKKRYSGKVKMIYIDPPYNTRGDSFKYNDRFNHSTWLTFMKNRLEIAKDLLSEDGSIWITLDDVELHYLKVICDEIFGRKCFLNTIAWKHSDNSNNNALTFSEDHNFILVYSKRPGWRPKFLNDPQKRKHFKNPDNDPNGPWFDGNPVNNPGLRTNLQFEITTPNGNIIKHPPNGWRWSKETMDKKFETGELRFSEDETRIIRRTYLKDMEGLPPSTLWTSMETTGHTRRAKYELKKLFPDTPVTSLFSTPKPESLINHILDLTTDEGDLILDFFMGSATTQAVAHKKKRQYIGIEQMDYVGDISVSRLKKVISGEQGGVSSELKWEGGGDFIYTELYSLNKKFVDKIQNKKNFKELGNVLNEIKDSAYLNFKVDLEKMTFDNNDFQRLSLKEQKDVLIQVLEMNQLYLNYSEIEDSQYDISDSIKAFNYSFYQDQEEGDSNE
ncbi:site-specific DNA-methyltransferase [Aliicoccus persicus]|uniref:Adenine-specific DNA-methyltransferase n=1 Tax=Aliicoccus persicus TaxID=930138 RepID=A0A662Z9C7_9STAP|nr:site-specific DNA-methyltransferase [Aliicoccus persicus]SEW19587.1 adenine-specific DNA-methyltransferase [Aliicoccus persicus]